MTLPTRTVEPTAFVAGEKVEWTRSFDDYPASAWGLVYKIRGPGAGIDVTATADGDAFVMTVLPTASDDITVAGRYRMQGMVTKTADATNKVVVFDGFVAVTIALASATTAIESRSAAKIMLDAIDAALLSTGQVVEYEITTPAGGRKVKRISRTEAIAERKYWAGIVTNEYAREAAANGRPLMQSIQMRVYDE